MMAGEPVRRAMEYSFELGMDALNFLQEMTKVLVDSAAQLMATA
jgi:hypothetical protein